MNSYITRITNFWLVFFILIFFFSNDIFSQIAINKVSKNQYIIDLKNSGVTSIGVYNSDSVLVKTLVSSSKLNAGAYTIYWDGKDDNNISVPDGNYILKVLTNNLQYTWEGAHIGNTSTDSYGTTKHHVYSNLCDITITGTNAVYVSGYSERLPSAFAFNTEDIQRKINVFKSGSSTPFITRVATDGINNYYACYDAYDKSKSFIMASKCIDNSQVTFSSGTNYSLGAFTDTYNVFGLLNKDSGAIEGIAAQAGNSYIYAARPNINSIYVYNKNTGARVAVITSFVNPKSLAFDKSGHLWISSGINTIARYSVKSDGSLTPDGINITGVITPGKIDVSYNSANVGVIDIATQQIKVFSNLNGLAIRTLGSVGGYNNDANVFNDKFYLIEPGSGFCYVSDGTIWLADTGNNRFLHISSTGIYIEQIQIQHTVYFTRVDLADTTRIFGQFLEFAVDYSKPLSANTGWSFVRNWDAQIPDTIYQKAEGFKSIRTFTDGATKRTFAFLRRNDYKRGYELVELTTKGSIRFTGMIKDSYLLDDSGALFAGDGNIQSDGGAIAFNKHTFTKAYDVSNNPLWSSVTDVVFDISGMKGDDAALANSVITANNNFITTDNKVVMFNNSVGVSTVNHIGFGNKYSNSFFAKTAKSTFKNYRGIFPDPQYFDIGNDVGNNSAASINVLGKIAIANYHGENWRGAQTNKFNVYYSNGLPLGQFGTTRYDSPGESQPEMEGNALTPQLVKGETSDIGYLYHGGESDHSAINRWKITGLQNIQEQNVVIKLPNLTTVSLSLTGVDLLDGLVSGTVLGRGKYEWTGDLEENNLTQFNAQVGVMNINKATPDLSLNYSSTTSEKSVSRILQTLPVSLATWSIVGNIALSGFPNTSNFRGGGYFEVLDNTGNIICQLNNLFDTNVSDNKLKVIGNGQILYQGSEINGGYILNNLQPFVISASGPILSFTYNGITQTTSTVTDKYADISKPTTLRLRFYPGGNLANHGIDVDDLKFLNKKSQLIKMDIIPIKTFSILPFLLNASSTSNLPVTYNIISGPAKVLGNIVTLTGVGTVIIEATQAGNDAYDAATPVRQSFTVSPIRVDL